MRVFIDTNVVMEAMLNRENADIARKTLTVIESRNVSAYITTQSFCTMAYLLERGLKKMNILNPERVAQLRSMLVNILDCFKVADLSSKSLRKAVCDEAFDDVEDSCQYQAAVNSGCEILVTFNFSDFKKKNGSVIVMSPSDFVDYMM